VTYCASASAGKAAKSGTAAALLASALLLGLLGGRPQASALDGSIKRAASSSRPRTSLLPLSPAGGLLAVDAVATGSCRSSCARSGACRTPCPCRACICSPNTSVKPLGCPACCIKPSLPAVSFWVASAAPSTSHTTTVRHLQHSSSGTGAPALCCYTEHRQQQPQHAAPQHPHAASGRSPCAACRCKPTAGFRLRQMQTTCMRSYAPGCLY
jgi:hypothetical protein